MTENMKNFLQKVSGDEELREKLKGMQTKEEVIASAGELGFTLTEEDVAPPEGELNEDELAAVAGGGRWDGWCSCVFAGGGGGTNKKDGRTFACACVGAGTGDDGDDDGSMNCFCVVASQGMPDWTVVEH